MTRALFGVAALACVVPAVLRAQIGLPNYPDGPMRRNAAYVELGGAGGLYSLNLDRRLGRRDLARFGFTVWDMTNLDNERWRVNGVIAGVGRLFDVTSVFGGDGRWIEAGAALVAGSFLHEQYDVTEGDGAFTMLVPNVGLRNQRDAGRWMFRVNFTPYIPIAGGRDVYPGRAAPALGGAIALGYVF